jgi:hypothetical protein
VVPLGEYFLANKKEGLLRDQQRGENKKTLPPRRHQIKIISWNLGKTLKRMLKIQPLALSAFSRENSIIVSELSATLDTYKARVLELEEQLK